MKAEWERISSTADRDWTGIHMIGLESVFPQEHAEGFRRAGMSIDGLDALTHAWKRLEERTLMRATVSTARSWQGSHEYKRSELQAFMDTPKLWWIFLTQGEGSPSTVPRLRELAWRALAGNLDMWQRFLELTRNLAWSSQRAGSTREKLKLSRP